MATEQQIQTKIQKWLTTQGCYVVKVVSASKAGVPDLLVCSPSGYFVGIEVKRPSTKDNTSKLQEYNLELIKDCGGYSLVAWDLEGVEEFFDREGLLS